MSDSEDEVQDWLQLAPQSVLKKGEKDFAPDGTYSQVSVLQRSRNVMYEAIGTGPRHGKHALRGSWDPEQRMCRVEHQRGTFLNTIGVCKRGVFWLTPEETLYLIQRGSLFFYVNGSLQSIEAACAFCLPYVDQSELLVYFYLKKLGYVVVRPPEDHQYYMRQSPHPRRILETITGPWHKSFAWRRCYSSFDSIYRDLQFIQAHNPPLDKSGQLTFHVWKPNTKYKKSAPPAPDFYVKVLDARAQPMPSLAETNRLFQCIPEELHGRSPAARIKNGKRTLILGVVDSGIVSFVKVMDTVFERV